MVHSFAWVVPSLMVAIGSAVAVPVQAPARVSDVEIVEAIRAGHAGKSVEHICQVPTGGGAHYVITLEGPLGRIMRVARDAARQNTVLATGDLPRYMLHRTMSVSVTGGVWEPQDLPPGSTYFPGELPPTPPGRARTPHASGIELALAGAGVEIPPVSAGSRRFRPLPLELEFDLAAVALEDDGIDVHVSGSASASCRIGKRTLDHLR